MAKRAAPRRAACVFCGGRDLTKEHVYPKWLRQHYGDAEGVLSIVERSSGATRKHPQVPFDITVKSVCTRCNSGWMNGLETAASPWLVPLMRGEATALPAHALLALSAWTFKTVLMIHEQADSHERVIHDDSYAYLYEHQEPPPGVQIWLAEHGASLEDRVAVAFSTIDRLVITQSSDKETPEGTAFYGAALALGRLIMLVMGRNDGTAMPEFADVAPWMRLAWPNDKATLWPPVRSVDDQGGFWSFYGRIFPASES